MISHVGGDRTGLMKVRLGSLAGLFSTLIANDKPLIWLKLDEISGTTATDSGSNNGGYSYHGSPTTPTLSMAGLAAAGDRSIGMISGSNQYVGSNSNIATPTSALTVECLFLTISTSAQIFVSHMDVGAALGPSYAFDLSLGAGASPAFKGEVMSGTSVVTLTSSTNIVVGNAYHGMMTADSTSTLLYLNGVQVASGSGVASINSGSGLPLRVGASYNSGGVFQPLNGRLQHFALYDKKLSATDALARARAAGLAA